MITNYFLIEKSSKKKEADLTVIIVDGFQGMCQNYGLWFQSGFTRKVLLVLEEVSVREKNVYLCFAKDPSPILTYILRR